MPADFRNAFKYDYDRTDFTFDFLDCLNTIKPSSEYDWSLELSKSQIVQPIKFFYKRNRVSNSFALIFEHKYGKGDEKRKGKSETARKLFEELGFEVHAYCDLKKSQMVEKFDLAQCQAD